MSNSRPNHTRLIIILALIAAAIVAVFLLLYFTANPGPQETINTTEPEQQQVVDGQPAPEELLADELPPPDSAPDPYAAEFSALTQEHGPIHSWPEETHDDFRARLIEAGYLGFAPGEPDERDISQDEALKAARDAVVQVYGVSAETVEAIQPYCVLNVGNPDKPVWQIDLLPEDVSQRGYNVYVLAHTGEVVVILSDENSNG